MLKIHTGLLPLLVALFLVGCRGIDPPPSQTSDTSTTDTSTAAVPERATPSDRTESGDGESELSAKIQRDETISATHPVELFLTSLALPMQINGDLLILYGQVLDTKGNPVPGTAVEIWQTDANGVYDHPGDSGTSSRDMTFQFYGTAIVDPEGGFAFRTIVPGRYEPRPRHIHFKVKQNGNTLLTSQFYFSDDIAEVEGEGMFQAVGGSGDLLLQQLVQGDSYLLANGQIVVDTGGGSGALPLTPSQGEGPYYPVVTVADFDNDLVTLP